MSTYRKVFLSGEVVSWSGGASFQVLRAECELDIEFLYRGQTVAKAEGVGSSYYYRPRAGFDQVRVKAASGGLVVVDISDADSGVNVLSGLVEVSGVVQVDPVPVKASPAYGGQQTITAGAGRYGCVGVLNPSGSGRKVLIDSMNVSTGVSADIVYQICRGAQASYEALDSYSFLPVVAYSSSSAAGVSRVVRCSPSSVSSFVGDRVGRKSTTKSVDLTFAAPIELLEGDLLVGYCTTTQVETAGIFEVRERANG